MAPKKQSVKDQQVPKDQAQQDQAQQAQTQTQVPKAQTQAQQTQSVSIVLIETNGTLKTLKTKEVSAESLYKKCGFRVSDDFLCRHTWEVTLKDEFYVISVWAKKTGKANFENKYDFPPPIDKELFFGQCAVVRVDKAGQFLDLTKETWLKIYEHLFGGFEDIGDEDEFSEDELESVDPALLTTHGYLKDDFVVSDKESANVSAEPSDVSDTTSETEVEIKKPKKTTKKAVKKQKEEEIEDTSELEEEIYTFSDDD
jgi:hypothetical protein